MNFEFDRKPEQISLSASAFAAASGRPPPEIRSQQVQVCRPYATDMEMNQGTAGTDIQLTEPDGTTTPPTSGLPVIVKKQIPSYRCPSALNTDLTGWGFATASYDGNRYFFNHHQTRRRGEVNDGMSYTITVSESGTYNGTTGWTPANGYQTAWFAAPIYSNRPEYAAGSYALPNYPPNTHQYGFNSAHPGGVHCLAGDGAVHFISNGVNPCVWMSLGTITPFKNGNYAQYGAAGVWKQAVHPSYPDRFDEIQATWDDAG